MLSRWRKLARLPALCVALALSGCAYVAVPMSDEAPHPAVRVADRWLVRNAPGFAAQRPTLSAIVLDSGPYWLVRYEAPPGAVTTAPQILVAKVGGRIARVDYGQ
jgi:hypothetical protein